MKDSRRAFITQVAAGMTAVKTSAAVFPKEKAEDQLTVPAHPEPASTAAPAPVDFRYAPLDGQAAFCFPDDTYKSLIGSSGELRYGHPGTNINIDAFSAVVHFSAFGMEADHVTRQELEAPGVPIVNTWIERPEAQLELTPFATNRSGEGRVDNVILRVHNSGTDEIHVRPLLRVITSGSMEAVPIGDGATTRVIGTDGACFMVTDTHVTASPALSGWSLAASGLPSRPSAPLQVFFRFPQERQPAERLLKGLREPDSLLAEAQQYWRAYELWGSAVKWQLPGRYNEFLAACARNILQAREVKNGRKTFQVGPTCYRGLWIVDGNFILEAARYLGFDREAAQGLEATWARQQPTGGVFASAPGEHWKDTAIAMFTMVRQAELSGDWSYFREMVPNLLKAANFLREVRDRGRTEDSANGRYGLLARGFGDGGLGGLRSELANTVWTLAGLRATIDAAQRLGLAQRFEPVRRFYTELRSAFFAAAPREMRKHPNGFEYLPMLMREDPAWELPDPWQRPRPQIAQWALSHAIYPGLVFGKDDPIVRGHIELMQACTREDIPAETGWLAHEGVWTYNAPFVSHVYLWAGLNSWAERTFTGFLNHATPLYCWREEQPLRDSMVAEYWGDMPHNWASAECILYLRHMFALEDGPSLRLLAGIAGNSLSDSEPAVLEQTPTRFGRLNLRLTPASGGKNWRLEFSRGRGPAPDHIELPARLAQNAAFSNIKGARFERKGASIIIDGEADSFTAEWKA